MCVFNKCYYLFEKTTKNTKLAILRFPIWPPEALWAKLNKKHSFLTLNFSVILSVQDSAWPIYVKYIFFFAKIGIKMRAKSRFYAALWVLLSVASPILLNNSGISMATLFL